MKMDQIIKGHVHAGDVLFAKETQKICGRTLSHKGLLKLNEIIKDHKNTSFDSLKQLSALYSTIWDDLCET